MNLTILLEEGVWLAEGEGDPPRTLVEDNARIFPNMRKALLGLRDARKYRPFENAEIQEDFI